MALPTTAPTILTLKQNFLTTQTRLLSQPLEPSRAWRRGNNNSNNSAEDEQVQALPERAVNDALYRLNHTVQQYARRVYALQATRHVAEQIDRLYLDFGDSHSNKRRRRNEVPNDDGEDGADDDDDDDGEDAWRVMGADYANPSIISSLPSEWDSPREAEAHPLEAKRYAELTTHLQDLSTRKAQVEARVARLRRMKTLLAPFDPAAAAINNNNEDDKDDFEMTDSNNNVQRNLVTRDGEVEKELERMRMLLVRVADKVARLREREGTTGTDEGTDELFGDGEAMVVDDVEVVERRKVQGLLDGMV